MWIHTTLRPYTLLSERIRSELSALMFVYFPRWQTPPYSRRT